MIDAIVRQTTLSTTKRIVQQVGQVFLSGLNTLTDAGNTDHGVLYGSYVHSGGTYTLNLYKDITKSALVATASTASLPAVATITAQNDSGLSGHAVLISYTEDDLAIVVQALLSVDSDLPMANLETLAQYDPLVGFAAYHEQAFSYMVHEFLRSRYASVLFNPEYQCLPAGCLDATKLRAGGYDASRALNVDVLREAAAHYAFSRLCDQQTVEPNSTFDMRGKDSRNRVQAYLHAVDIAFDRNSDTKEDMRRSMSTWRVSR